jgi:ubiquinone/menaquinone biosynthesis C-methylase UbiE
MLAIARTRAAELARPIALVEGDAEELPFGDATFETVVCTYSLCGVSDVDRTVAEMKRVLRRGGRLLLVDHIESAVKPILWLQRLLELVTSRREGEYFTRRPLLNVKAAGFEILARDRLRAGVIERVVALRTDG